MSCQIIKWPSSPAALIFHPRLLLYHCIPVSNVIYVWILKWSFPSSICHIDMKVILEILSHKLLHCTTKKIDYFIGRVQFSSVAQSCLSLCNTPESLQHTLLPCPSPTPRVYPDPCLLSQWCHPTISSSVVPFSSCPQSFPSIRVFSNESAPCIRWPK